MFWAEKIRRGRFVVVGRAGMDLYADPPGTRTEDAVQFTAALGGSSANIAVALARLGQQVALVSTVSDDAVGRFCLNELARYGVDTAHVRSLRGEMRTSLAVVETRPVPQSVIYRNNAADFGLSVADIGLDWASVGALILTGTALAVDPSCTACLAAMSQAHAACVPVVLDIDYRPYSWESRAKAAGAYAAAAHFADIVVGNDDEFGVLAGDYDAGLALARKMGCRSTGFVVYKMGARGAITISPECEFETPIFPVAALKPTGAGDAFMGGLMAGLADGLPLSDAVTQGAAAAAIVVTRVGCAPAMPTQTEVNDFMKAHHAHPAV